MATPKLHLISFDICPYVERSRIVLEEKNIPYDITYIDLSEKPDWFLKISPRGKVPVLLVDDAPIFESMVINEFIEEAYTSDVSMLPEDPFLRAQARAWIVYNNDVLMPALLDVMFSDDTKQSLDVLMSALAKVEMQLDERTPYFQGEDFGLVDAAYAPLFTRWEILEDLGHGTLLTRFPKLERYKDNLLSKVSVKSARDSNLTPKTHAYIEQRRERVAGEAAQTPV